MMDSKSEIDSNKDSTRCCTVTGLPILQKPEWIDVSFGSDYRVTFCLIGARILWVKTTGITTYHDVSRFIQMSREILSENLPDDGHFVLINDWSELRRGSKAARSAYIDYVKKNEKLLGVIFYGASPMLKMGIKMARRFNVFQSTIDLAEDYAEAVRMARQALAKALPAPGDHTSGQDIGAAAFSGDPIGKKVVSNPDWVYQDQNFSLRFEIIDDHVLHAIPEGRPQDKHIVPALRLQERIMRAMQIQGGRYFVINLSRTSGIGQKARKLYVKETLELHQHYPFHMYLVYDASKLLKAAINLTRPFIPFRILVVDDLMAALKTIASDQAGVLKPSAKGPAAELLPVTPESGQIQQYIHDLLSFLEKIDWEEKGLTTSRELDPDHPFGPVFDAIELIKWEFDDLFEARMREKEEKIELEARLQRAQKMEAIGTLAGGVAHDLNNVLSGIVGYPDLLLMNLPEDSHLRKPLMTIKQAGEKAAAIVQDLLTLARRGTAENKVTNLNEIVTDYLESPEFQKMHSYHPDVHVSTRLESGLLNIRGSPVHLSKMLMNLVSNAAEAMPHGGTITISTENRYLDTPLDRTEEIPEGEYAVVEISDTGEGIAEADLDRIFEPFYTKKAMGRSGTGLGMSVVWGTVKDHRGHIDAKSARGEGATFTLYFPATHEAMPDDETLHSADDILGNGERILIVDDIPEQRTIASEMLIRLGYAVDSVPSGEAAVEYLKKHSCDLVVLDMIMDPGMDGLETYKQIIAFKPHQKAIIASGFAETGRTKMAQRLGAGTYIKKPYTMEKIGVAVKRNLAASKPPVYEI